MNDMQEWPVEIIRSRRRKKTISAALQDERIIIRAPHDVPEKELQAVIANLRKRLQRRMERQERLGSDEHLEELARQVNAEYFDGRLQWQSIRYVTNQNKRFGSCTPADKTIRISHRVATMPPWVLKYVVIHELAHLQEANHGPAFWALVNRYPRTERARGYLMAVGLEELDEA